MSSKTKHREEGYWPKTGSYHSSMNALGDVWIPVVVSTFGASHGVVLTIVERLTIGYQKKAARTHISTIVTQCGLSRSRVSEVLEDLEAMGIIAVRDRARGRRPLVEIDPDWKPTPEKLELGNEKRRTRRKAKHPEGNARLDSLKPEMSTPVDNSDVQPGQQEDVYPGGHLEQNEMSTPVDNEMSDPVDILKKGNKKDPVGGKGGGEVSASGEGLPGSNTKDKKTPPPSSSRNPGSNTNPGEQRKLFGDDDETENFSESSGRVEKETRVNGDRSPGAAKKSWQSLADDIATLPEETLTEEARELGDALREKVSRINVPRARRLSLYMIETGNVEHLGATVAATEKKLKYEVQNTWSYLLKTLSPLPGAEARNGTTDARESFLSAYESARPARTLGGAARRHHFEGVTNVHPRNTDDYLEKF